MASDEEDILRVLHTYYAFDLSIKHGLISAIVSK